MSGCALCLTTLWLVAAGDPATQSVAPEPVPAAQPIAGGTAPTSATTAPISPAPAPWPPPPPARAWPRPIPFRLGLTYSRVLGEDGDLTNDQLSTNAIGLNFDFPSTTYSRSHFGIANQWESAGSYSARGFRIDLISFGYPINLVDSNVRLDLEPIVTLVRGEIMFVSGGHTFLRMEGGFGLELSATYRQWFLSLEPDVDFRYWTYAKNDSQTGFGRIFPLRFAFGHEF